MMDETLHHVVVIGGGFGGLQTVRALRKAPVRVTLLDRRNFHLFQPLLYQVATGTLSPANIAAPLRALFTHDRNIDVRLAEVHGIDLAGRRVQLGDGSSLSYDTLVVAAGASHSYFGHPEWERYAPGLKSVEDATLIRQRILSAFERAELLPPGPERDAWLTFVVVGGGPTGTELLGQLAEIADRTLVGEFRAIRSEDARIHLVEAGDRVLGAYPTKLSDKARQVLEKFGIEIHMTSRVRNVDADGVDYTHDDISHRLAAKTVLWAAGNQASPLAKLLADAAQAELDRNGRIVVGTDPLAAGPCRSLRDRRLGQRERRGGKASARRGAGRDAARTLRSRLDPPTLARRGGETVPLSRSGLDGDDRPDARRRRSRLDPIDRHSRLARVARHPYRVDHPVPEPTPRPDPMGLALLHRQPLGTLDHELQADEAREVAGARSEQVDWLALPY